MEGGGAGEAPLHANGGPSGRTMSDGGIAYTPSL